MNGVVSGSISEFWTDPCIRFVLYVGALCGLLHVGAGAFFFFAALLVAVFSTSNLLALRNLPFGTWERARLHCSGVLQVFSPSLM